MSTSSIQSSPGWKLSRENFSPHDYQIEGLSLMLKLGAAGLFLKPGMGKTIIGLTAYQRLKDAGMVDTLLVVAPLRPCYQVWPFELDKWEHLRDLKCGVLQGDAKAKTYRDKKDIYCINPSGLKWFSALGVPKSWGRTMLIVDESTDFKDTKSQRSKLLKGLLNKFTRRYIFTGTPSPRGFEDLFGQIFILDGGATLGKYISHYRSEFFHPAGFNNYAWALNEGAEEKIIDKVKPFCLHMSPEKCLNLPALMENDIFIEAPLEARTHYNNMKRTLLTQLESGEDVMAPNVAASLMKLRQIANGIVYLEDGRKETLHAEKFEALKELLSSLQGSPLLLFYNFTSEAEEICKRHHCPNLSKLTGPAFLQACAAFNTGAIPLVICHPASAAYGLNLQAASADVAWFGLTYDMLHYEQGNARILRQGNPHPHVHIHHIMMRGGIDETMLSVVKRKGSLQNLLLEGLK